MEQRHRVSEEEFEICRPCGKGRNVDPGKNTTFIDLIDEDCEDSDLGRT